MPVSFVSIGLTANQLQDLPYSLREDVGLLLDSPVPTSLSLLLLPSGKTGRQVTGDSVGPSFRARILLQSSNLSVAQEPR